MMNGDWETACLQLGAMREHPLLVLYYPDEGGLMDALDTEDCYKVLRRDLNPDSRVPELDVLLHTYGGDPTAAYRLAKCLRYFADRVTFLVPECAYSAGTLLVLSGNEVRFGHNAGISPIDVSLVSEYEHIELTAIDYYMQFVRDSQDGIQRVLKQHGLTAASQVGSDLLCRLVDQVQAIKVGSYYRQRMLTREYATELLDRFMLAGIPNAPGRRNKLLHNLLFTAPAHEFQVDYDQSIAYGVVAEAMSTRESDTSKAVVNGLRALAQNGEICPSIDDWRRFPFFFYSDASSPEPGAGNADETRGEP